MSVENFVGESKRGAGAAIELRGRGVNAGSKHDIPVVYDAIHGIESPALTPRPLNSITEVLPEVGVDMYWGQF